MKLWHIPETGLEESICNPECTFSHRQRRVEVVRWHPTAEFLLSTVSYTKLSLWDVTSQQELFCKTSNLSLNPFFIKHFYSFHIFFFSQRWTFRRDTVVELEARRHATRNFVQRQAAPNNRSARGQVNRHVVLESSEHQGLACRLAWRRQKDIDNWLWRREASSSLHQRPEKSLWSDKDAWTWLQHWVTKKSSHIYVIIGKHRQ